MSAGWTACFTTFCGKVIGFHITDPRWGSVKPVCQNRDQQHDEATLIEHAHLIAAAPAMQMALSNLVAMKDLLGINSYREVEAWMENCFIMPAIEEARAALAKSEGK